MFQFKLRALALTALLALLFVMIAPISAQDATPGATAEATASADAFPVTIEHKFGSTTIAAAPKRVVTIGFNDQDAVLALGVTPVAVRYWYGDEKDAVFPWADALVNGPKPEVLNMAFGSLNYEAILALKPDLIVALYSGITEDEYKQLSAIAPTIAQTAGTIDFGMPWQDATVEIGTALGKHDEAVALVAKVEGQVKASRDANPGFASKSIAVIYAYSVGSYGFYTAQDPRARFFTDLGFVVPDELSKIAGTEFYADVSKEKLDLIDRDLIVFVGLQFVEGGQEAVTADPIFAQLKAVKEGRIVYVANHYDDAIQFSTVLSIPFALEHIVPEVSAALGLPTATAEATAAVRATAEATP